MPVKKVRHTEFHHVSSECFLEIALPSSFFSLGSRLLMFLGTGKR